MACQYQPHNDNDDLHTEARSATVQRKRDRVYGNTSIEQEKDKHTAPIETEDGEEEVLVWVDVMGVKMMQVAKMRL